MTAILTLAIIVTAAGSIYLTVKAWSLLFSGDLIGWLCLKSIAEGLGEITSTLLDSMNS